MFQNVQRYCLDEDRFFMNFCWSLDPSSEVITKDELAKILKEGTYMERAFACICTVLPCLAAELNIPVFAVPFARFCCFVCVFNHYLCHLMYALL